MIMALRCRYGQFAMGRLECNSVASVPCGASVRETLSLTDEKRSPHQSLVAQQSFAVDAIYIHICELLFDSQRKNFYCTISQSNLWPAMNGTTCNFPLSVSATFSDAGWT